MLEEKPMTKSKYIAEAAVLSGLAAILGLIGIYFPPLGLISNLVWLIPLVVVTMRWGFAKGALSLVVSAILMAMLSSPVDALLLMVQYGGLALVYGYSFRKEARLSVTLLRGILAAALGSVLMIALSILLLGLEPSALTEEMRQASQMTMRLYEETGMLERFAEQGISQEQLSSMMDSVSQLMITIIPSILVVVSILSAVLSLFLTHKILKRLKLKVPSKMPPFRAWRVDFRFVYGFIGGLAVYLLSDYLAILWLQTLGINLLVAFGFVFVVQGAAVLASMFHLLKGKILARALLVAVLFLFLGTLLYLLLFIGLFDLFFDYRKRLDMKGENHEGNTQ